MSSENSKILKKLDVITAMLGDLTTLYNHGGKVDDTAVTEVALVNQKYARFELTEEAFKKFKQFRRDAGSSWPKHWGQDKIKRDDPCLIKVIREMEEPGYVAIRVITIPSIVKWFINTSEGVEYVEEIHRGWTPGGSCYWIEAAGGIFKAIGGVGTSAPMRGYQ